MSNYPFLKDHKIVLKPLNIGWGRDYSDAPVMAAEAWQFGPVKPRNAKRAKEIPAKDVSLQNLKHEYAWVEVRDVVQIRDLAEARRFVGSDCDADAYIVTTSYTEEAGAILAVLAQKDIPIIPEWDNWGYAWVGRMILGWSEEIGFRSFLPTCAEDVDDLLRALRAVSMLRQTKILYIGNIPSHSCNAETRPLNLFQKFKADFRQINFKEFTDTVDSFVGTEAAGQLAEQWIQRHKVMDGREKVLNRYTAIYLALKRLLAKYDANALSVDCAYSPSVEYVACCAASYLIDEGCCFGCEGDISQLISLQLLMGVSGNAGLMGNLFANAIHSDIEENTIVINHDVLPPSMACQNCKMCLRDFHDTEKGSTFFADMPKSPVTICGLSYDGKKFWVSDGCVKWVEDTVHCRISIGIDVKDAKAIMRKSLGHHQVMAYGEYKKALLLAGHFMGFEAYEI